MTTKVISGYAKSVYLTAPYSTLSITSTGSVGASGITTGNVGAYTVSNQGTVFAATTYNGSSPPTGTDGLILGDGGLVINGASGNTAALIAGLIGVDIRKAAGTVVNYGVINNGLVNRDGAGPDVLLEAGGQVTNGSAADTTAEIQYGIWAVSIAGAGTVVNFGTLSGGYVGYAGFGDTGGGIDITSAGTVTNGSATDTGAKIYGAVFGVTMSGAGQVTNYGTIIANGYQRYATDRPTLYGIEMGVGSSVRNGSATDTVAMISSNKVGVVAGSVTNYGVIFGDTNAVEVTGDVTNYGTIQGDTTGVRANGGTVTNFGTITGDYAGVRVTGGIIANYGTILSDSGGNDHAVVLGSATSTSGMMLTNGSSDDAAALIEGQIKGVGAGPVTIINFGTIENSGKTAVTLGTGNDLMIEEAGGVLAGPVNGGGGTNTFELGQGTGSLANLSATDFLDFSQFLVASGGTWTLTGSNTIAKNATLEVDGTLNGLGDWTNNGTITGTVGLNAAGGGQTFRNAGVIDGLVLGAATDVLQLVKGQVNGVVSGGRGTLELVEPSGTLAGIGTRFTGFGTVEVDTGAVWTLTGGNTLAAGENVTIAGTLVNEGRLSGAGSIQLDGGRLINVTGATIATSITTGTAPTTVSNAGTMVGLTLGSTADRLIFVAGAAFSGPVDGGGGTLELAGAATLTGLGSKFTNFGLVQIDAAARRTLSGTNQIAAGETLAALGSLAVTGTLSNDGVAKIEAGLTVGGSVAGVFDNLAGGTLELLGTLGVTAGAASGSRLVNAGLLEKTTNTGATTLTVGASLADTGTIAIGAGALSLDGPTNSIAGKVSGAGTLILGGGKTTLAKGAAMTIATWRIIGAQTDATLATSLSYAGTLGLGAGATIGLDQGVTWTLGAGGKAIITAATIDGAGLVVAKGSSAVSGLVLGGSVEWENFGTWTQTGVVTLGGSAGLENAAGAVFNITNDSAIKHTASGTFIDNAGLFEKTGGSAISSIAAAITNVGTISGEVATLALTGAVTGTGKIEIGGAATVETGGTVAATQTVIFGGHNADLVILDAAGFKAKIDDFAQTDKLDFRQVAKDGSTKLSYVAGTGGGTLTVTDGTHSATVALLGQFAAAGFSTGADGAGGTVVTYTPPSAAHVLTLAAPSG